MSTSGTTPTPDAWESYFYPETYNAATGAGTLINKYHQRDPVLLANREYDETHRRAFELEVGAVTIAPTYDANHLRAIHRHLFANVYDWAGEYRTVDMSKNLSSFADLADIDRYLGDANRLIISTDWPALDRQGFADASAEVFAYVNQAHPFREGNGRASKIFMQHVAELSHFRLDYDPIKTGVTAQVWNQRSMLSGPDLGKYEPHPEELRPVFFNLAQQAPAGPSQTTAVARAVRAQHGASQPLSQALRKTTPGTQAPTQAPRRDYGQGTGNDRGQGYRPGR